MLTINYSWWRFLSPCGHRCHINCHRIMPMHSQVDSCILNWAYSLTHPKESLDTLRTPMDKCPCACKGSSQVFLLNESIFPRLKNQGFEFKSIPILCQNHLSHCTSLIIHYLALSKPPSSTLSTSSTLLLILQVHYMQRSDNPSSEGERRTRVFQMKGGVRLECSLFYFHLILVDRLD